MLGLVRWNPVDELTSLHREMDRLFNRVFSREPVVAGNVGTFVPAMEVVPSTDEWKVRVALPGIDPNNVDVELTGNTLTIRGERQQAGRSDEPYMSEFSYGRFERTITLPSTIDAEKATANYRHGILELSLPWKESAKPRRIQIEGTDQKALAA